MFVDLIFYCSYVRIVRNNITSILIIREDNLEFRQYTCAVGNTGVSRDITSCSLVDVHQIIWHKIQFFVDTDVTISNLAVK